MPTLTIDGVSLEVVGIPSWSEGGGSPSAAYIEATVRVPGSIRLLDLDKSDVRVVLDLGDGSSVAGQGMWRVGRLQTDGGTATLRFEGDRVTEQS